MLFFTGGMCIEEVVDRLLGDLGSTWGIKGTQERGVGLLVLLVAHLSYLRLLVFSSHEGGSLNCPKTPPGWRLFPFICTGEDARAIYRTPLE